MSYPEPPPPPIAEPTSPPIGRRLKRLYICGVLGLLMAAGFGASAFWPWLTPVLGGEAVSGWDIYQSAGGTGENAFLITEAFRDGFSPLFTGLTVIVAAGVLAVAAVVLMVAPKVPQPSQWGVPRWLGTVVSLTGSVVVLTSLVSLASLLFTQPRPYLINPGAGLIGGVFLATIGGLALVIGATGSPGRRGRSPRAGGAGASPG